MQRCVQPVFDCQVSGFAVNEGNGGAHGVEIEFLTWLVWMGQDAAIGNHQRLAIRTQQNFMRTDPACFNFTDASYRTARNIIDAKQAPAADEIVLHGVEKSSVGGKATVTIKMSAHLGCNELRFGFFERAQYERKGSRSARKGHKCLSVRGDSDTVTSVRQSNTRIFLTCFIENTDEIRTARIHQWAGKKGRVHCS